MPPQNNVNKAWLNARNTRDITDNFIFHSDRGVKYASNKMTSVFYYNRKKTP